jgi:hypothetical protein
VFRVLWKTRGFTDIPLPTLYAEAYDPDTATPVTITERKFGQNLSGDMIPVREVQAAEVEKESTGSSESKKRGFLRPRRRNGACTEWSGTWICLETVKGRSSIVVSVAPETKLPQN